MKETKTSSILLRLPVILAVTAASYGLPAQAESMREVGMNRAQAAHDSVTSTRAPAQARSVRLPAAS
jgi:hypothetical protein